MLSRMVVGLLFKACLSLALLLGIASYGHYLSGGDPGALWGRVAGGAARSVGDAFGTVGERAGAPVRAIAGVGGEDGTGVWTWRDENGVTHFASARPEDPAAELVHVDPDANVLAPFRGPDAGADAAGEGVSARDGPTIGRSGSGEGEPMPGLTGALLRARGDAAGVDPETAEALLRVLQGGRH